MLDSCLEKSRFLTNFYKNVLIYHYNKFVFCTKGKQSVL